MATGPEAVDEVAAKTGMPRSAVDIHARPLKQSDLNLWPKSVQGGGKKSAHVWPHHLANLAFALADDRPATEAPESADDIGSMSCVFAANILAGPTTDLVNDWKRHIGEPWPDPSDAALMEAARQPMQRNPAFRVIPGAMMRHGVSNLIDWLSRPEGKALRDEWTKTNGFQILIVRESGYDTTARISYYEELPRTGHGHEAASEYFHPELPFNTNFDKVSGKTPATIRRTARLNIYLFAVMADLWADTRARTGVVWSPSKPALAGAGGNGYPKHAKAGGMAVPPAQRDGRLSGQPTGERTAQRDSEHPIKPPRTKQRDLNLSADRTPQRDLKGSEYAERSCG